MYHIHVKPKNNKNHFKKSDELIFVLIEENNLFCIDIRNHDTFNEAPLELLKIVDSNWEWLLNKYELKGILCPEVSDHFSSKEIINLIKKGVNTIYPVNGKCISPIGGGTVCSGQNANVITASIQLLSMIEFYRSCLKTKHKKIIRQFRRSGVAERNLIFGIKEISMSEVMFYEKKSGKILNLNRENENC